MLIAQLPHFDHLPYRSPIPEIKPIHELSLRSLVCIFEEPNEGIGARVCSLDGHFECDRLIFHWLSNIRECFKGAEVLV
jgi:hypothetical protein